MYIIHSLHVVTLILNLEIYKREIRNYENAVLKLMVVNH